MESEIKKRKHDYGQTSWCVKHYPKTKAELLADLKATTEQYEGYRIGSAAATKELNERIDRLEVELENCRIGTARQKNAFCAEIERLKAELENYRRGKGR